MEGQLTEIFYNISGMFMDNVKHSKHSNPGVQTRLSVRSVQALVALKKLTEYTVDHLHVWNPGLGDNGPYRDVLLVELTARRFIAARELDQQLVGISLVLLLASSQAPQPKNRSRYRCLKDSV